MYFFYTSCNTFLVKMRFADKVNRVEIKLSIYLYTQDRLLIFRCEHYWWPPDLRHWLLIIKRCCKSFLHIQSFHNLFAQGCSQRGRELKRRQRIDRERKTKSKIFWKESLIMIIFKELSLIVQSLCASIYLRKSYQNVNRAFVYIVDFTAFLIQNI